MSEITLRDLADYLWREYEWITDGVTRIYRIESPVALYSREGGETHRILDAAGVVHIVPAPGCHGCVLRYKKADGAEPVTF